MKKRITRTMLREAAPHLCYAGRSSVPALINKTIPKCGVNLEVFKELVKKWHFDYVLNYETYNWEVDLQAVLGIFLVEDEPRLKKVLKAFPWWLDCKKCLSDGKGYLLVRWGGSKAEAMKELLEEPFK